MRSRMFVGLHFESLTRTAFFVRRSDAAISRGGLSPVQVISSDQFALNRWNLFHPFALHIASVF